MKGSRKIWIFFLIVGFLAALLVGWQRNIVEKSNKNVEITLDYQDTFNLAQAQSYDLEKMLLKFKKAGVVSLALSEKTLDDLELSGQVGILSKSQVTSLNLLTGQKSFPTAGQTYLLTYNQALYQQLKTALANKLGTGKIKDLSSGDRYIIAVMLPQEQIRDLPLFLAQDELALTKKLGFNIVPRLGNYTRVDSAGIKSVFTQLDGYDNLSTVIFLGEEVLGYKLTDNYLPFTKERIQAKGLHLGLIEFNEQKGLATLTKLLSYQAVRVHSIPSKEAEKMTMDTALSRWVRAVQERNVRLVYLRPLTNQSALQGKDPLLANVKYVEQLKDNFKNAGFTLGKSTSFSNYQVSLPLCFLLCLGILAALALLWQMFFPSRGDYIIFLGGLLCLLALIFTGHLYQARKIMALGAAVTFPTLAMLMLLQNLTQKNNPFLVLAQISALSVAGGLFVAALLSDTSFFLKINAFSGVKFIHLIPLFLLTLYYFFFFQKEKKRKFYVTIEKILNQPILVKYVLLFFLLAGMALVYILRTGNQTGPLPVLGIEMKIRQLLENILLARPRTKEFFLGHPALLLGVYLAARKETTYFFLFLVLAAIGQISIVSTFTHVHTPLYLSLLRTVNGLVLGSLVGALLIGCIKFIRKGVAR